MKTFKFPTLLLALMCLISCSKTERINRDFEDVFNQPTTAQTASISLPASVIGTNMVSAEQNIIPSDISFCNPKTVSLCSKNTKVGSVTIQRGSNNKVYITYSLTGNYYFKALQLFTGVASAIPMVKKETNVCAYPYKKSYNAPFTIQQYTFVLSNQPISFTVAAQAVIVQKQGNNYKKVEDAWADGCTGTKISTVASNVQHDGDDDDDEDDHNGNNDHNQSGDHDGNHNNNDHSADHQNCSNGNHDKDDDNDDDGDDEGSNCKGGKYATTFNYTGAVCPVPVVAATALPEPDICSFPTVYFFGIHPIFNAPKPWDVAIVTVGGFDYTEAEGRVIANLAYNSGPGNNSNAKEAFLQVGSLKLSYTGYALSPTVGPAVNTIESWLKTVGKLSPSNLPTGNAAVKNATIVIANFMQLHRCPDKIE